MAFTGLDWFYECFARDTHLFFEKSSTFAGFSHHHVVRLLVLSHCCFLRAPVLGLVGLSSSIAVVGVTQFQSGRCNVFGLGFRVEVVFTLKVVVSG